MAHDVYALGIQDASLTPAAFALPAASATTRSAQIDLGSTGGKNARVEDWEIEIQAPALAVGELANAQTVTYGIEHSTASGSGYAVLADEIIVQTGAGGAGASATSGTFRLPRNTDRYINVVAVASAGGGTPSTQNCTVKLYFHA